MVVGVIALIWAVLIARTKFPEITQEHNGDQGSFRELLRYPNFLCAIVAQFLYVGAQVGTWSYFIQYVQDGTRQPEKIAGYFLTGTLVAFGVGRFSSAALMRYIKPATLMGVYSLINIGLVAVWRGFPRLGRALGYLHHQLLHVRHVPNYFCSRHRRPGAEHKNWRLTDRDGHRGRRCSYPADGLDL